MNKKHAITLSAMGFSIALASQLSFGQQAAPGEKNILIVCGDENGRYAKCTSLDDRSLELGSHDRDQLPGLVRLDHARRVPHRPSIHAPDGSDRAAGGEVNRRRELPPEHGGNGGGGAAQRLESPRSFHPGRRAR